MSAAKTLLYAALGKRGGGDKSLPVAGGRLDCGPDVRLLASLLHDLVADGVRVLPAPQRRTPLVGQSSPVSSVCSESRRTRRGRGSREAATGRPLDCSSRDGIVCLNGDKGRGMKHSLGTWQCSSRNQFYCNRNHSPPFNGEERVTTC